MHVRGSAPKVVGLLASNEGYRIVAYLHGDVGVFAFEPDGTPDLSFRGRGWQLYEVGTGLGPDEDMPKAATWLDDGRLVVAGRSFNKFGGNAQSLLVVDANGFPDRRFGKVGSVRIPRLWEAKSVAASESGIYTLSRHHEKRKDGTSKISARLARIGFDGRLEKEFSGDGIVALQRFDVSFAGGLALSGTGEPVVLASRTMPYEGRMRTISRLYAFDSKGRPDRSFGVGGSSETPPFAFEASEMIGLEDGGFLASGRKYPGGKETVLAFRPDGMIDRGFGTGGWLDVEDYLLPMVATPDGGFAAWNGARVSRFDRAGAVTGESIDLPARYRRFIATNGHDVVVPAVGQVGQRAGAESPYLVGLGPDLKIDPALEDASRTGFEHSYSLVNHGFVDLAVSGGGDLIATDAVVYRTGISKMHPDGRLAGNFGIGGRFEIPKGEPFRRMDGLVTSSTGEVWLFPRDSYDDESSVVPVESEALGEPVRPDVSGLEYRMDVTPAASGRLVFFGGSITEPTGEERRHRIIQVVRVEADGDRDPSFGVGGATTLRKPYSLWPVDSSKDLRGRIIVVAFRCRSAVRCSSRESVSRTFVVYRLRRNGKLDRKFGNRGSVVLRAPRGSAALDVTSLADGRTLVRVGRECGRACFQPPRFVALEEDGSTNDYGVRPYADFRSRVRMNVVDVFPAGEGGVLMAGTVLRCGADPRFGVARFDRRGRPDGSFGGGDGFLLAPYRGGFGGQAMAAVRQGRGTITIGGKGFVRGPQGGAQSAGSLYRFDLSANDGDGMKDGCHH